MFKLGIIGYPLGHSISAVIQKAGLKSIGLEGSYDVMETPPEDLINRIKFIKTNGYNGFNVTIPLKVPMSLFLDDIDDYANIAGCVNTVKVGDDKSFFGYNTDIYGFKKAIPETINLAGKNASILGTGGASRAAVVGCSSKCPKITSSTPPRRLISSARPPCAVSMGTGMPDMAELGCWSNVNTDEIPPICFARSTARSISA